MEFRLQDPVIIKSASILKNIYCVSYYFSFLLLKKSYRKSLKCILKLSINFIYIYKKLVFQFFEWKNIVFEYEAPTFSFLILFFFKN